MSNGYLDILILILIFFGLQLWWIIPIIKGNKEIKIKNNKLKTKVELLEKIYKK